MRVHLTVDSWKKKCRAGDNTGTVLRNEHWRAEKHLKDLLDIPEGMEEYVNDLKINVFEIAWLTDEQISMFKSDFRIVADFFVRKRKNKDYVPDNKTEIRHVDAVLKDAVCGNRGQKI